jgi:exonuclease III
MDRIRSEETPHTQGVALMLSKPAHRALIGWEAHGPRIITATLRTKKKKINMNVIQCYAPTNERGEDSKDQFYSRLQTIVESCPGRDFTIMMVYFNAKIGNDNTGWEEVMDRHGLGHQRQRGEICRSVCITQLGHRWKHLSS